MPIQRDRVSQLSAVQQEALALFARKNADYGDAFAGYGPVGVLVRLGDKVSRLSSVTKTGINLVNTESLRDTLIDLHNYSAMAVMLLDESKSNIENPRIAKLKKESCLEKMKDSYLADLRLRHDSKEAEEVDFTALVKDLIREQLRCRRQRVRRGKESLYAIFESGSRSPKIYVFYGTFRRLRVAVRAFKLKGIDWTWEKGTLLRFIRGAVTDLLPREWSPLLLSTPWKLSAFLSRGFKEKVGNRAYNKVSNALSSLPCCTADHEALLEVSAAIPGLQAGKLIEQMSDDKCNMLIFVFMGGASIQFAIVTVDKQIDIESCQITIEGWSDKVGGIFEWITKLKCARDPAEVTLFLGSNLGFINNCVDAKNRVPGKPPYREYDREALTAGFATSRSVFADLGTNERKQRFGTASSDAFAFAEKVLKGLAPLADKVVSGKDLKVEGETWPGGPSGGIGYLTAFLQEKEASLTKP